MTRDNNKKIWERLPEETSINYTAFVKYRDLQSRRSIKKVAELSDGAQISKFNRWSSEFKWVDRARAYDDHIDELRRNTIDNQIKKSLTEYKAKCDSILDKSLDLYMENLNQDKIEIKSTRDLERLIKLQMTVHEGDISEEDKIVNIIFETYHDKPSADKEITDDQDLNVDKIDEKKPVKRNPDDEILDFDPERDLI
jgi:hypothetical protein